MRDPLRVAINVGNPVLAQRDPATGALSGISVDIAAELGRRMGVAIEPIVFKAAGDVSAAARDDTWDIAFLAVDPVRAADITFTAPYVQIEGTYLVRDDGPFRNVQDLDRDGVTIAVGRNSAYDLFLTRTLRHARLVRDATGNEAIDMFMGGGVDAAGGIKQPLTAFAAAHPGTRVTPGRFMVINQAMAMPRGRDDGIGALRSFVEDIKASGLVARLIATYGQHDASVAPADG